MRFILTSAFVSLAVATVVALSVAIGWTATENARQHIGGALAELAFQMRDKLDRSMFERWADIQVAAASDDLADPDQPVAAKRALLERMLAAYGGYAWIGFAGTDGRITAATDGLLEGVNVAERPWFKEGLEGPMAGDVHEAALLATLLPDPRNGALRFVDIAAPVMSDDGRLVGVLGAHLDWAWADELRDSLTRYREAHQGNVDILVVSRNGVVLLGPESVAGRPLDLPSVHAAAAGSAGFIAEVWPDGKRYLTGYAPSIGYRSYPGLGWAVLVRQEARDAFAPALALERNIMILGAGAIILFMGAAWHIAGWVTAPLQAISRAADRIGQGNADITMPQVTRGAAEIASLAASLNAMMARLAFKKKALEAANETLELRVAERTALLQSVIDGVTDPIFVKDPEGRLVTVNRRACDVFGMPRTAIIGLRATDLLPPDAAAKATAAERDVLATGATRTIEEILPERCGIRVYLTALAPWRDAGDRIVGVIGIARDITELKAREEQLRASERRFRDFAEAASDWFWEMGPDLRFTYMSPRYAETVGVEADWLIGRTRDELPGATKDPEAWRQYLERVEARQPFRDFIYYHTLPDGRGLHTKISGVPVFSDDGAFLGYRGTGTDVTAMQAAEEMRRTLEAQIQHSQRLEALGTLAGGIAHDINNALLPVISLTRMAVDDLPERSPLREDLGVVLSAADRVRDLVRRILAFSRGEAICLDRSVVLADILHDTLQMLRPTIPSTTRLDAAAAESMARDEVLGDPGQLSQVIVNIVMNAAQAIGMAAGGRIDIALRSLPPGAPEVPPPARRDAAHLCLSVTDNGPGMDEDTLRRSLEPFFTTKPVGEGTGLGLSIVHGIVTNHRGSLRIESTPGRGTAVHVFLPIRSSTTPSPALDRMPAAESI